MQSDLTESVQASIRPGDMVDTYYYGETNIEKQAYPCIVNNRFVQNFTNPLKNELFFTEFIYERTNFIVICS